MDKESKKKVLKKYIFISFLLIAIATSILLMIKYNVEGEKNMPFQLDKIIIKSSIDAQSRESENLWDLSLSQNNDIYIYIKKSDNANDDEKIRKVKIEKITITDPNDLGNIKILLPTSNDIKTNYLQSTDDFLGKDIEYTANTTDNMNNREICQDGGMIAFRISNQEIGQYISNEGEEVQYNGSLLTIAGIEEKQIQFKVKMDLIIETTNDEKYKGEINLDLPVDSFGDNGVVDKEITDFSNIIFKRSE